MKVCVPNSLERNDALCKKWWVENPALVDSWPTFNFQLSYDLQLDSSSGNSSTQRRHRKGREQFVTNSRRKQIRLVCFWVCKADLKSSPMMTLRAPNLDRESDFGGLSQRITHGRFFSVILLFSTWSSDPISKKKHPSQRLAIHFGSSWKTLVGWWRFFCRSIGSLIGNAGKQMNERLEE